ncbi:MAG TPA: OmpA family protein [Thermoanaerobaculales bacterium]|nr:OmpA family protein [Thermoanaerobaculales bacterium]HQL30933.1 OmpA family protein [Thermoanaerobaculales bacterium]HQP44131.1 OmpA family protein [Thermoanaerobaculales bacterium]
MRKSLVPAVVLLVVVGVALTGCATKKFVNEQVAASEKVTATKIGEVQTSVEANQKAVSDLQAKDADLQKQISTLSDTAKDALKRAEEAGVLAKGDFLWETVLTDENVKFGFNKAELSPEAKAALDAFAAKVKADNKNVYVEIQGHTDNVGSEKVNLKLGYDRAESVMHYLQMQHGFPLHRMNVTSYGEYKPIVDNATKEGRAQNRRVAIVVLQ